MLRHTLGAVGAFGLLLVGPLHAQGPVPGPTQSAPIANIRYEVTFDSATAVQKTIKVRMSFDVKGAGDVLLSLPSWTPGAYEVSNYARFVSLFTPMGDGNLLRWDKLDYDTWRIRAAGSKTVVVAFDYFADSLDNAFAWSRPDFAFFNGTNLFLYPEGRGTDFAATVTIKTQSGWKVATGMRPGTSGSYAEKNYHDLVDMPFLVGHFDYDSLKVGDKWARLATYPAGQLGGAARDSVWHDIARMIPAEAAVFQEKPWDNYTTMMVFNKDFGGGSALEHQASHLGIYNPQFIGTPILPSITAHEMFHSWNVKRLRPAEMVPYRYDVAEPTPWLWVSEGITDYYADLTMVRGGIVDSAAFFESTVGKIQNVDQSNPVALEDASLSTWIHPTDGTGYLYYPKGSLAGFMLDIIIRDASDNKQSLDDVMRSVYRSTYKAGKGFGAGDWWGAVVKASGGKNFQEFYDKYVDGREAYPWSTLLPLAGLRMASDTVMQPRMGISSSADSTGIHVTQVAPGSSAEEAGVQAGDVLVAVGELQLTTDNDFGPAFRKAYANRAGEDLNYTVRRGGQTVVLKGKVKLLPAVTVRLEADPAATPKAARIRHGILTGTTGS
ncbi:MAG TPA: PDZ domain-containing protein [Gemmatimonadales bacterium]|nr:PDZ domain-containing protein [Gemmatimonadales bacterium]